MTIIESNKRLTSCRGAAYPKLSISLLTDHLYLSEAARSNVEFERSRETDKLAISLCCCKTAELNSPNMSIMEVNGVRLAFAFAVSYRFDIERA